MVSSCLQVNLVVRLQGTLLSRESGFFAIIFALISILTLAFSHDNFAIQCCTFVHAGGVADSSLCGFENTEGRVMN